jgi:zinc protease
MIKALTASLLAASALIAPTFAYAQSQPADLVKQVNIPHQNFTLKNGMRVIVHTDRKAPVVAVSIWYDVGSKHEPKGKTGFAHLFEHLMFNGSENADYDFFKPTQEMGATDLNGTTWFDRTNYFQTVPKGALDRILYLESDRMGHLLGAVTQEKLQVQIGVVQNEKRQSDNQPYGMVEYAKLKAMVPAGHPYGHSTIGSMADLDAASMDDVRGWFKQHYGPNNAVLVLAGDIDVKTAKPLVEKYFGQIKPGPKQAGVKVDIPTLDAPKVEVMKDRVATVRAYRTWVAPGEDHPDSVPLDVAATVLGGLASSRLDNVLVREEKLAVSVTSSYQGFAQLGEFDVYANARPGVDPMVMAKRMDEVIAQFMREGPTEDEVRRVQMRAMSGRIAGLEQVGGFGGKAVALAEGALYRNDSADYKKRLEALAKVTPAQVKDAMARWLSRPVYALYVKPGDRDPYEDAKGTAAPKTASSIARQKRAAMPAIKDNPDLTFPKTERTMLSNGIELVYAQRTAVPMTYVALQLDAGHAADPRSKLGTQRLMLSLLEEGAAGRTSTQLAEEQERLGASVYSNAGLDRTTIGLNALSANLDASLGVFSDIVLRPDFEAKEVERLRNQQLASIANELKQPNTIAFRVLPPLIYGPQHPYGIGLTGRGDPASVKSITRDDIQGFHAAWVQPAKAKFYVTSDRPLAEVKQALEKRFADWKAVADPGAKPADIAPVAMTPKIMVIDQPDSPQSVILAGQVTPARGTDDNLAANTANTALGSDFLARINMNLREQKSWSYGSYGFVYEVEGQMPYLISAPVQADKTGDAIVEIQKEIKSFLTDKGITEEERGRILSGNIRELPGRFETSSAVLNAMISNDQFKRPADYYTKIAGKYRAMTANEMDQSIRKMLKADQFLWVVVGDAKKVKPQLEKIGLPIETITLPTDK